MLETGLDINNGTVCCPDTDFCYIDTTYRAECCAVGSNCGYTACDTNHYQCKTTTTVSGTASETSSCCPRSCTSATSQFLCPSSLGGACCSYGATCASGGSCIASTTSSSTTTTNGCATTQTTCPSSLGGGCCNSPSTCTLLSGTNFYCASGTTAAVRTGSNGQTFSTSLPTSSSGGLSSGAKAGIGAGIGVGGALLIVGLISFCIVHRRHAQAMSEAQSQSQQRAPTGSVQESATQGSKPAMSQGSGVGRSKRPPAARQMTQSSDYFGPDPVVGPFTEGSLIASPISPDTSRGVPSKPQSPGDITIPVEIDSNANPHQTRPSDPKDGPMGFIAELP